MKKTYRNAALLLAALLQTMLLTGCSGSNTGVWIAVIVMVFIAVFSATSGVVYLVLQKLLPSEKPAPRTRRTREVEYETPSRPQYPPSRPANRTGSQPASGTNGVWICPRDKSRNTGPYCTVCGSNRPMAPRSASRPAGQNAAAQRPVKTQSPPVQQSASYDTKPAGFTRQEPQNTYRAPAPAHQPVQKPEYRGAFVRQPQSEPSVLDTDFDSDVDSELLEAIFREAAQGSDGDCLQD